MKRLKSYEALAAVSGIVGAFALVAALLPSINPGFVDTNGSGTYSPKMALLLPALLPLSLLGVSWHITKRAQAIRRELERLQHPADAPSERLLSWMASGIVILVVVLAFLLLN